MRHGRAKQARKTLQFFQRITNGAIRPPYSILLDGTFLVALIQYKLQDEMTCRLDRLLQHAAIHLITTRSTLVELQKLEQAVVISKNDSEKALVFRQARAWAETNCMRILENDDIPDESTVDISAIPTTPSSVMQQQQQQQGKNKRARGGGGRGGISDLSMVGRDFLRIAMAVLVQEEGEAKEKSATAAAATDDSTAAKEGEGSGNAKEENNSRREGQRSRDHFGKRQNQHHQQHHHQHCYYFVASQDEQVLDRLRHLGHVPIIRLARGSVLLLEQPSKAATQQAWREERLKWRLGVGSAAAGTGATTGNNKGAAASATSSMLQQERNEAQRLVNEERQERRREQQQQQQQQPYAARHKKRAKGPNPLSCKPGSKKKQKT